ncbi:hypothetical protein GGR56DRAFT_88984 [Xylariaceae sp. FL0804]|nr:hypothetical protein GGR56DRAFT_88984 [Xylariaceae sp. FL0804]
MPSLSIALTALLAGLAAAARPQQRARRSAAAMSENVSVSDFTVTETIGTAANGSTTVTVSGVSFLLTGDDATDLECDAATGVPSEVITCGDSDYSFALYPAPDGYAAYTLRVYHALGVAVGYYGEGSVPVYCHAGGGSNEDCSQVVTPVNITIDSLPDKN